MRQRIVVSGALAAVVVSVAACSMGDPESWWGRLWGHDGAGPGYSTSAFHAPDAGGASVCAMCSVEGDARAEAIVFAVLDALRRAP